MDAKRGAPRASTCAWRSPGAWCRRARWLLGTGLSILGWPLQVVALLLAPLVVVQPALAAGLLVLMFLGERMLGEHAGRREHLAMAAIVLGVIGAGAVRAAAQHRPRARSDLTITLVLVGLGLASLLPYAAARAAPPAGRRDDDRRRARRSAGAASRRSSPPTTSRTGTPAGGGRVGALDRRAPRRSACSAR